MVEVITRDYSPSYPFNDNAALAAEPSLDELWNDPILHLLMQQDGVSRQSLTPVIDHISELLAQRKTA